MEPEEVVPRHCDNVTIRPELHGKGTVGVEVVVGGELLGSCC